MAQLAARVRKKLKTLVFRRVAQMAPSGLYQTRYYTDPSTYTKITTFSDLSAQEVKQNIEFRYHDYYGWSSPASLRDNDPFPASAVFLEKKTFGSDLMWLWCIIIDSKVNGDHLYCYKVLIYFLV